MKEIEFTKKHLFDFEMKFKPILVERKIIKSDAKLDTTLLIKLSRDLDGFTDKETIFDFLYTYQDILNWISVIYDNAKIINSNIDRFLDSFNQYFVDNYCWYLLSQRLFDYNSTVSRNTIRKYKDKFDWKNSNLSRNVCYKFGWDFILEMKDYVDFSYLIESELGEENHSQNKFLTQMKIYTLDHLEEVLSYKREDEFNK